MGLFSKPDVVVKCYTDEELGKLLNWLRSQQGLSGLSHNRFDTTTVMSSPLGAQPTKVLYFEVSVPHYMYARLRDKFIKESAFDEVILQEQVLRQITDS